MLTFNYWSKGSSVAQTVKCNASDIKVWQGLHALIKSVLWMQSNLLWVKHVKCTHLFVCFSTLPLKMFLKRVSQKCCSRIIFIIIFVERFADLYFCGQSFLKVFWLIENLKEHLFEIEQIFCNIRNVHIVTCINFNASSHKIKVVIKKKTTDPECALFISK